MKELLGVFVQFTAGLSAASLAASDGHHYHEHWRQSVDSCGRVSLGQSHWTMLPGPERPSEAALGIWVSGKRSGNFEASFLSAPLIVR